MAGISTKGSYGLAAMYELALHYGQGHLQIRDIAEKANIPQNYLEQILATLRKEFHQRLGKVFESLIGL